MSIEARIHSRKRNPDQRDGNHSPNPNDPNQHSVSKSLLKASRSQTWRLSNNSFDLKCGIGKKQKDRIQVKFDNASNNDFYFL